MTSYFTLTLQPKFSVDTAWKKLSEQGAIPLFSEEDEDIPATIVVAVEKDFQWEENFPFISGVEPFTFGDINWEEEWKKHCTDYREDGFVHVDLGRYGSSGEILLKPGPGFGDMTHPTTRLVLRMMADVVRGKDVVDIGSGSGILSFAAAAMGARSVVGVEIDEDAIIHAYENAKLNGLQDVVHFCTPEKFAFAKSDDVVILMNMITSEQEVAWCLLSQLHHIPGQSLVSGMIDVVKEEYLEMVAAWGWELLEGHQEEDWIGLQLIRRV